MQQINIGSGLLKNKFQKFIKYTLNLNLNFKIIQKGFCNYDQNKLKKKQ